MHGLQHIEINTGTGAVKTVSTSVLGLVVTGPAADAAFFPAGELVLVTDIGAAIAKAGATGTALASLTAIAKIVSPVLVIIRAAVGADDEATEDNILAAITKLSQAPQLIGVRPRILGAPGLDTAPIRTALAVAAGKAKLDAFGYAASIGDDTAERIADRNTVGARELMLIAGDFKSGADTLKATAMAMGLRAWIDQTQGPQKTLSNVAVPGVTGLTEPLSWSLMADQATDVQLLNENDITGLVAFNGFRFWGNRTASDDPLFAFESTVRVGQMLRDLIGNAVATFLDKELTPQLAKDLVEYINRELARASRPGGWLLGGTAWLDVTINDVNGLKSGKLAIDYDYEVPSPLEHLQLRQRITDRYYADFTAKAAA